MQLGESGHNQTPMFKVKSDWKLPKDLPNLSSASLIGLDTEAKDPDLKKKGPGVRRDGYTVGISVAVPEGESWYLPFAHSTGEQFEKENIIKWAKDNLCNPNQPKIGSNILYDLDYLYHMGIKVTEPFYDIGVAEPLIDENRFKYGLDALALKYLGESKREKLLEEECKNNGFKGKPQGHIWRVDPKYVGEYAEGDAQQALQIFQKQQVILEEQGLGQIFDIETRLVPMLLHMRQTGVPIDTEKVLEVHERLRRDLESHEMNLNKFAGFEIDYWTPTSIAKAFDNLDLTYPMTPKTNKPSFTKPWLEIQDSEICKKIINCRKLYKFIGTFLEGSILDSIINNKIHCQFNQLKSDDDGTVSGRLSSSKPNLQQVPSPDKDPVLGQLCRSFFIPEEGYGWCSADYSQIEIRILAHYARGKGSDDIREAFHNNSSIDYHQWCADRAAKSSPGFKGKTGRKKAKTINFGIIYGQGPRSLSEKLNVSFEEGKVFYNDFLNELPFIKTTMDEAKGVAEERGYVTTILGRRRRFDLWEPADWDLSKRIKASTDKSKLLRQIDSYGPGYKKGLRRAKTYKAFNAVDQGSAADLMKKAMVDIWESGVCSIIKPYITVHDEIDFGYPKTKEGRECLKEVEQIMIDAIPLKVPVKVDVETGPNWGEVK